MRFDNYKDIGRYLRQSRERQGWTIQECAEVIHIRPKYIEALEEGRLSEIPGNSFVRGYLLLYAEVLMINGQEIVANFMSVTDLEPQSEFFVPEPNRKEYRPDAQMIYMSIGFMLAVYLSWMAFLSPAPLTIVQVEAVPQHLAQIGECGNRFCN